MIPVRGTLEQPERGAWVADLIFSEMPTGSFALVPGETSWIGTVTTVIDGGGQMFAARIVGGKGGLSKILPDKWYRGGATGNTIASDIIRAAGEVQGTLNLPDRCPQYQRMKGSAGEQLDALCDLLGVHWWTERDGSISAGPRVTGVIDTKDRIRTSVGPDGTVTLSVKDTLGLAPGMTWAGVTARHVRYEISDKILVELCPVPWAAIFAAPLDFAATHKAQVESQNSNGTLNLIVDGRFSLTQVPWLGGVPAKVTIAPGDLVSVGFWNKDLRQPYAFAVNQLTGTLAPSARVQDAIEGGTLVMGQLGSAPFTVSAIYVPPTPWPTPDNAGKAQAAITHALAVTAAIGALTGGGFATLPPIALSGLISSGDPRILH